MGSVHVRRVPGSSHGGLGGLGGHADGARMWQTWWTGRNGAGLGEQADKDRTGRTRVG